MKTICGKTVYEHVAEAAQPARTALLIVDMQNDFAHPNGHHGQGGRDVSRIASIVTPLINLVTAARESGVLVVWILNTALANGQVASPSWLAARTRRFSSWEYTMDGTWGHQVVEPLRPLDHEPVVKKWRASAFVNTPLDALLRSHQIETVVVTGCVTEGCVASTAHAASSHDYYTYLASDCVASTSVEMHEAALTALSGQYPAYGSGEYARIWGAVGELGLEEGDR